tara:strand:+ start:2875 stop:3822 length:948 start_codon:yes stop_codon:yes gene_type:complete
MARCKPINFVAKEIVDGAGSLKLGIRDAVGEAGDVAELMIMDEIGQSWDGEGITHRGVSSFLSRVSGKTLKVRIASIGGSVWEGLGIFNDLISFPGEIIVEIESIAGSIASVIAMAGDVVRIRENASFQIHKASCCTMGNSISHRDQAKTLEMIDEQILAIYEARGSMGREELEAWIVGDDNDGTFFDAEASLKAGFVDEIIRTPKKGKKPSAETTPVVANGDRTITASITLPANYEVEDLVIRNTSLKKVESGVVVAVATDPEVDDVVPLEISDETKVLIIAAQKKREAVLARSSGRMREESMRRFEERMQTSS